MSIVTSVLSKFGFITAIYPKLVAFETKLAPFEARVRSGRIQGRRAWSSHVKAQQFQQQLMNQRTMNESFYRVPAAR